MTSLPLNSGSDLFFDSPIKLRFLFGETPILDGGDLVFIGDALDEDGTYLRY